MNLLKSLFRTFCCALFLTLFNLSLTRFRTVYHFDRSRFNALTQLSASLLFSSSSRSRITNCFFRKMVCLTTRPTIAANTDLLPSMQTTDGRELTFELDWECETECVFEFDTEFVLAHDCVSSSLPFRRDDELLLLLVLAVFDLMIFGVLRLRLLLALYSRAAFYNPRIV